MIKQMVCLSQIKPEVWTDDHLKMVEKFICDASQRFILFYVDSVGGFMVSNSCPVFQVDELQYFIKKQGKQLNVEVKDTLHYGKIRGSYLESLLRHMSGIYAPMFFQNSSWPDSIFLRFYTAK